MERKAAGVGNVPEPYLLVRWRGLATPRTPRSAKNYSRSI